MSVLDTISRVEEQDEETARLLLRFALYEATCDEVDRMRPHLELDALAGISKQASKALIALSRSPVNKAAGDHATHLSGVVVGAEQARQRILGLVTKAESDDDPNTDYWDARGADGRFRSGRIRRGILNGLGFATGAKDQGMQDKTRDVASALVGDGADKYSRMRSLGGGLVATGDPTAAATGTVMRLIGDIGPEAQKALEPGIRRTAYRYRGTERRPNRELQQRASQLARGLMGPGNDQRRMEMTSTLGVAELVNQVPDKKTAQISLAAGKMPPSVGLMFDSNGRVISEAMGFNGDHYLPFDLKNLKRMKGGSYVRTRTTGGLTDEDIYTGLMTGARHVTVVSNSGVFTLEFDPDLRGGRRYSDKARQMVDRYGRLVAAIGSGELLQRELPKEQDRKLRTEALAAAGGNAENADKIYSTKRKEALAAAKFTALEDDDLMDQAEAQVKEQGQRQGADFQREVKTVFNELKAQQIEGTARTFRLDGEGYKAALKALKTEFPYFIRRSTFTPLQEYMDSRRLTKPGDPRRPRGGSDIGYTEPGGLDPRGKGSLGGRRKAESEDKTTTEDKTKTGATGSTGGTGSAPAAPGARTTEAVAAATLATKRAPLHNAIQHSLKARTAVQSEAWGEYTRQSDKQLPPEGDAIAGGVEAYLEWLDEKHGGQWTAITDHLLQADTRALQMLVDGIDGMKAKAKKLNIDDQYGTFDEAKKQLEDILVLRKPFADGDDPYKVPLAGELHPQRIKDVADLELKPEAITAWLATPEGQAANDVMTKLKWDNATDEEIRSSIEPKAQQLAHLKTWAKDPTSPPPPGLQDTPENQTARDVVGQLKDQAPLAQQVAAMNRAWALQRLRRVAAASGGLGAADPFAKGLRPRSTPSRLVWHDPQSEVAKAVRRSQAARGGPARR